MAKLLLLVIVMLGIGGYVFYVTNPVSLKPKDDVPRAASSSSAVPTANVTNVQLEGDGQRFTVMGLGKEMIDSELTSFVLSFQGPSLNVPAVFKRIQADLLVQNRGVRGGTIEIDVATMRTSREDLNRELLETVLQVRQYPRTTFTIKRVERGEGNAAVFVGDFTLRGVTKEMRVPFSRQGGALRGRGEFDPTTFDLKFPQGVEKISYAFSIGVK